MSDLPGQCSHGDELKAMYAREGIEATVSIAPPIVAPSYEDIALRCPCGTRWYAEPTSDQILQWQKDGVQ